MMKRVDLYHAVDTLLADFQNTKDIVFADHPQGFQEKIEDHIDALSLEECQRLSKMLFLSIQLVEAAVPPVQQSPFVPPQQHHRRVTSAGAGGSMEDSGSQGRRSAPAASWGQHRLSLATAGTGPTQSSGSDDPPPMASFVSDVQTNPSVSSRAAHSVLEMAKAHFHGMDPAARERMSRRGSTVNTIFASEVPSLAPSRMVSRRGSANSLAGSAASVADSCDTRHTFISTREATYVPSNGGMVEVATLNQYCILDTIGRGNQGTVYLAFDDIKEEFRAIKEVKKSLRTSAKMKQLTAEIEIMKGLRHKNIVSLYEVIDDPGSRLLFMVMQYVEKGSLVKYTNRYHTTCVPHDPVTFIYTAKQLAAGVSYLHSRQIYHRDIKPENMLLGVNDQVYLADFGVSFALQDTVGTASSSTGTSESRVSSIVAGSTGTTHANVLRNESEMNLSSAIPSGRTSDTVTTDGANSNSARASQAFPPTAGTPAFFSPEVVSGAPENSIDPAAQDMWALGVSFFMLLTGRLPWALGESGSTSATEEASSEGKSLYPLPVHDGLNTDQILTPTGSAPPSDSGATAGSTHRRSGDGFQDAGSDTGTSSPPPPLPLNNAAWEAYQSAVAEGTVQFPSSMPVAWKTVISRLLQKDPSKRIDAVELKRQIKSMTARNLDRPPRQTVVAYEEKPPTASRSPQKSSATSVTSESATSAATPPMAPLKSPQAPSTPAPPAEVSSPLAKKERSPSSPTLHRVNTAPGVSMNPKSSSEAASGDATTPENPPFSTSLSDRPDPQLRSPSHADRLRQEVETLRASSEDP